MGISVYLNNKIINSKLSDAFAKYDPDQNGFTKQEFDYAINDVTTVFARCIVKMTGIDTIVFNKINTDKNDVLSYKEISNYIAKAYKLEFNKISSMTVKEAYAEVNKNKKNKKIN